MMGAGRIVGLGLSLVATSFIIRGIGMGGYGKFSVAMAVSTLLVGAGDLGLGTLTARDLRVADGEGRDVVSEVWAGRRLVNRLAFVIGAGASLGLVATGRYSTALIAGVLSLGVPYLLSGNLASMVGFSVGNASRQAVVEVATKVIWVVIGVGIWLGKWSWEVALIGSISLGGAAVLVRNWLSGGRHIERVRGGAGVLRTAAPLSMFALIYLAFNRADVIGLAMGAGTSAVGRYSTCYRFADAMLGLGTGAVAVMAPRLAEKTSRRELHMRGRRRILLISGWMSALGMAAGPIWLRVLSGDQLGSMVRAEATVVLLGVGVVAYIAMQSDLVGLIAARRHKIMLVTVGTAAILEGVLVWALGRYSIVIAAGIVCGIEVGATFLTSMFCDKSGMSSEKLKGALGALAAGTVAGGIEVFLGAGVIAGAIGVFGVGIAGLASPALRGEIAGALGLVTSHLKARSSQ